MVDLRRALLVGIDNYPFGPLAGCVADANAMAGLLETHADGTPNFACRVVAGSTELVTRVQVLEALDLLFGTDADAALFYFSGHGTENNLDGYLVTSDAGQYREGVAMSEVLTLATNSHIREIVIIVDCCNSGHLGAIPAIDNAKAVLREGISVLTASRSNEPAVEASGRGLFTSLLCDALDGGASDVLGTVSAASAYAYVDQALGPWEQRPLLKAHVSRLTPLRRNMPSVPPVSLRLLPTIFTDPFADLPLDPSFEPQSKPRHSANEATFTQLQRFRAANLVEPVGEDHMYFAAMNSKACRLTALGRYYRQLAESGRL